MNVFQKINFWGKKHSPEILIASGIASSIAAIGMAIFATTKVNKTLAPYNKKIEKIKADLKDDNKIQNKEINVQECRKQLALTYAKAGGKMLLLYAPSALLFGLSTSCFLGSHKIMKNRNIALAATCATLERGYAAYRERVKEKLGKEAEDKLYKNIKEKKVEIVDEKTGKKKNEIVSVPHLDSKSGNPWNVLYDCGNVRWEPDAQLNFDYLMMTQAHLNEKLRRQGYLFLSDVYEHLGFTTAMIGADKMRAAHILGWIYDPKNPKRSNCVHFGLTELNTNVRLPYIDAQIRRNEPGFWLDINVDGDILSGEYGKEVFSNFARNGGVESGNY